MHGTWGCLCMAPGAAFGRDRGEDGEEGMVSSVETENLRKEGIVLWFEF